MTAMRHLCMNLFEREPSSLHRLVGNLYVLALMSVRNALQFIVRLCTDETLRKRLVCPDDAPELGSFVELGGKIGLSFTIEELRTAHKHNWGMRYLLYNRSDFPSGS